MVCLLHLKPCAECHFAIGQRLVFGMGSFYIYLFMAFSNDRSIHMERMKTGRKLLESGPWGDWLKQDTDQRKKLAPPPLQKPYPADAKLIDLVAANDLTVGNMPLIEAINRRQSHRRYTAEALTLEELSFLLWAAQGVQEIAKKGDATRRTVPSGGSRHPFELYLVVNRVNGLDPGLYRYLPLDHKLCFLWADPELSNKVTKACRKQAFVGKGALVFIWTTLPYRAEWRYSIVAHKMIAMDAGHSCQNLYLAGEAIGAGVCAIGAYNQQELDALLKVDGTDEFTIYAGVVGKVKP
jgi:SagB-type dehydrogenase family enzyme